MSGFRRGRAPETWVLAAFALAVPGGIALVVGEVTARPGLVVLGRALVTPLALMIGLVLLVVPWLLLQNARRERARRREEGGPET